MPAADGMINRSAGCITGGSLLRHFRSDCEQHCAGARGGLPCASGCGCPTSFGVYCALEGAGGQFGLYLFFLLIDALM
eukprot:12056064-Alexandrium_andersonii.AAC.1